MKPASACVSKAGLRGCLVVLCCSPALLLGGCGAVAGALVGQLVGGALADAITHDARAAAEARDLAVAGMDGSPIDYPVAAVYRELVKVAESDGLKIIGTDDATYTLRVSYPFSLAQNNWGGEITVTCVAEGSLTRVLFKDDGHDAVPRVRKIEATMLDGALQSLGQPKHGL